MKTPNTKRQTLVGIAVLLSAFILQPSAFADLSATVTPGYVFSTGERPTTATLNLLANPSISISGTVGGTNAGLAAKSVTGTMLADSVVDNVTVQYDGSSPRKIQVLTSGLAGPGLTGATAGGPLTNNVDGVTLVLTNDFIALASNLPPRYIGGTSNTIPVFYHGGWLTNLPPYQFYTNLVPQVTYSNGIAASGITTTAKLMDAAHGLGLTPHELMLVLKCTSTDLNYDAGDEVDARQALTTYYDGTAISLFSIFTTFANSTNAGCHARFNLNSNIGIPNKSTGVGADITKAKWTLILYARP